MNYDELCERIEFEGVIHRPFTIGTFGLIEYYVSSIFMDRFKLYDFEQVEEINKLTPLNKELTCFVCKDDILLLYSEDDNRGFILPPNTPFKLVDSDEAEHLKYVKILNDTPDVPVYIFDYLVNSETLVKHDIINEIYRKLKVIGIDESMVIIRPYGEPGYVIEVEITGTEVANVGQLAADIIKGMIKRLADIAFEEENLIGEQSGSHYLSFHYDFMEEMTNYDRSIPYNYQEKLHDVYKEAIDKVKTIKNMQ